MSRILIVEDEMTIAELEKDYLELSGFDVEIETDGTAGLERSLKEDFDLFILDLMLPDTDGFEICRRLRQHSDVPVIFLTARDTPEDELLGFGVGADDYIRKPYHSSVLLARIARLLRRKSSPVLQVRELTLCLADLTVRYQDQVQELTKNETRILACLMQKELCTRDELIEDLWNNSLYIDENTLYVNINRLRDKLKKIGADGYIRTVRGVGYRL